MKVHSKIVWDWDGNIIEDEAEDYSGPLSEAKGGSQKTTTTNTTEPWKPQQDYLKKGFEEAWTQFQSDKPQYYEGSTVAPTSAATQQGWNATMDTANTSTLPSTGSSYIESVLGGDYLKDPNAWASELTNPNLGQDPNAYIGNVSDSIWADVMPRITGNYALSGRSGSSPLAQAAIASDFTRGIAPYAFNAAEAAQNRLFQAGESALNRGTQLYGSERDRQMQALGQIPSMEESRYIAPNAMINVGQQQQDQSQRELTDDVNRWNFDQTVDASKLQDYMGLINGNYGQSSVSKTIQPTSGSPFLQGLGSVASLGGLAK